MHIYNVFLFRPDDLDNKLFKHLSTHLLLLQMYEKYLEPVDTRITYIYNIVMKHLKLDTSELLNPI